MLQSNNMINLSNSLDIDKAIIYLKANYKLYSIIDREKVIFYLKDNLVTIKSSKVTSRLSIYDLKEVYSKSSFFILENNEEEVDIQKDKEYYSWRQ